MSTPWVAPRWLQALLRNHSGQNLRINTRIPGTGGTFWDTISLGYTGRNLWKMRLILLLLHVGGGLHCSLSQNGKSNSILPSKCSIFKLNLTLYVFLSVTCSQPPRIDHAQVSDNSRKSQYHLEDVVYFTCEAGYISGPAIRYKCTASGWEVLRGGECYCEFLWLKMES